MNAVDVQGANAHSPYFLSGARVVIIEPNAATRELLRGAVEGAHTFVVAGVADSWQAGVALVEAFIPELLIIRDSELAAYALGRCASSAFPLVIQVGTRDTKATASPLETLSFPLQSSTVQAALDHARAETYARKAHELSDLLARYLMGAGNDRHYLSKLRVDDGGQSTEIPVEEITSISADGNYVRVHTLWKTYELRETMTGLSEKLDPRCFARVHRSFIVNLCFADGVVDKPGGSSVIVISSGSEIPVGPNYRDEVCATLERKLRLSA